MAILISVYLHDFSQLLKKIFVIVLVLVLGAQSTWRLWTMLAFYLNQDYISKNVCINRFDAIPICKGSCYLKAELHKAEKQEQKYPDLKQKEIINFFFEEHHRSDLKQISYFLSYSIQCNIHFHSNDHIYSVFHPPQLI
ncbi:MAG: hypothetical protein QM534_03095 [Sediminibacterium sp.]|nr:hypothetical protein [Sediminibacterium sp.]